MKRSVEEAVALLQQMVSLPSFSKEESRTADLLWSFLQKKGVEAQRLSNNIWAKNLYYDPGKPTFLLNSHHDTVRPNPGYTKDPFKPVIEGNKLFGLGSNDAGGSIVALAACFLHFYDENDLPFNLIYAATAEEEISGKNGIELLLPHLGKIDGGIVGEPTKMDIAVAERGLVVLDCIAHGVSGHAARDEGENAIYKALKDIDWFRTFSFPKVSETLGQVKMTVTIVNAGTQHNVVPARCEFTVDVRTTDAYDNQEVLEVIRQHVRSEIKPRSVRLNSSRISPSHPLVIAGRSLGRKLYGSPTSSDQALMRFPTIKMGPGDSSRSHTADEFIHVSEIAEGIDIYIQLLEQLKKEHEALAKGRARSGH